MEHSRAPAPFRTSGPGNLYRLLPRLVGPDRYQHLNFHAGKFVCIPLLIAGFHILIALNDKT
jgi:hypothetical protein